MNGRDGAIRSLNASRLRCWSPCFCVSVRRVHTSVARQRAFLALLLLFLAITPSALLPFDPGLPSQILTSSAFGQESSDPLVLFRTGEYVKCIEASAKSIALNEFQDRFRILKLRSELESGRYRDALVTLDDGLKKVPNSLELRWWGRDACRFNQQMERVKLLEDEIGQLVKQTPWRFSDSTNRTLLGRFLLSQGVDPKLILNGAFNTVKKQQPNFVPAYLASGDLALEKGDFELAAQSFQQAVKLDETDADAHFGLAKAYAPSDSKQANAALKSTLERNPNHIQALLMTVDELIDSERYEESETVLLHISTINPHQPQAEAYRAVLAHLRFQPEREKTHRELALKFWSTNPEVDHLIGKKLSQKYRFAEGAEYQRTALKFAADYLPAKMQLAQDLLRLGQEAEGWMLADAVYQADGYHVIAHNLVTLHQSVEKFRTLEADGIIARMDAREAEIYGNRVLTLLKRAKQVLCAKYDVQLKSPIIVEMFPKQEDFAIRTFGLPGGSGFLAVCFGTVITANSPASQGDSPTCWESTLWHEFCHVVTLNKTRNRMPRWLSEGISVYEERQANPTWGQEITPTTRKMLLGDELTPVDQLSSAFLRPPSPLHLQFAYLESSLVVEYLVEKHGIDVLKKILDDLGNGITINESLARHTGTADQTNLAQLNTEFVEFARKKATSIAPDADWAEPELPRRADAAQSLAWLKEHPTNYPGLKMLAQKLVQAKQWATAKEPLAAMRKLYPNDPSDDGLYPLLAEVHHELNEPAEERLVWEQFAALSDDHVEMFDRLTKFATETQEWDKAKTYANRWLSVNPLNPVPHRILAVASEQLNDVPGAIESNQALLLLSPIDTAELHLRLATLLRQQGTLIQAKRHALLALEEAPRYRAAHKELLAIVEAVQMGNHSSETADRPAAPDLPQTETQQ